MEQPARSARPPLSFVLDGFQHHDAITANSIVRNGKQLQMPILWRQGMRKTYSVLNFMEAYSVLVAAYQRTSARVK